MDIDFKTLLVAISDNLKEEMIKELLGQGHKASGKLIDSIENKVTEYVNGASAEISYLFYGRFLETGLSASAFTKPPGRAEIAAIVRWIKRKVIRVKKTIESFAWAIATNKRKVGFPSPNANQYSPNGRTIKFQSIAIENVQDEIEKKVQDFTEEQIDVILTDVINRIKPTSNHEHYIATRANK